MTYYYLLVPQKKNILILKHGISTILLYIVNIYIVQDFQRQTDEITIDYNISAVSLTGNFYSYHRNQNIPIL